ncbi:MAG: hypothetical protein FWC20_09990 [Oscillospiraceae bacterium]|nr:hypothetical protein [Oscillospiraceae bacterium]MCL2279718.1 hypothetical protein [Oscillospiraceae bacterium]
MKKTDILWRIMETIFLVIFNVVFFLLAGFEHSASVWISYVFIHFSFAMLIITPFLIRKGKSSWLFGATIYSISAFYFAVALIVGIVFIFIDPESINAPLVTQLILAGLYGIVLIANLIANEKTADAEEKRQYEIAYVKNASVKLKNMLDNIDDKSTKKQVEKVYDAVNSSPVKSHSSLSQLENDILQSISELEDVVEAENNDGAVSLAKSLLSTVNERNMRLKSLN